MQATRLSLISQRRYVLLSCCASCYAPCALSMLLGQQDLPSMRTPRLPCSFFSKPSNFLVRRVLAFFSLVMGAFALFMILFALSSSSCTPFSGQLSKGPLAA